MIAALVSMWWFRPPVWALFILMLPLVIDGLVQQKTRYESTNVRRLITGLLYGYALAGLIWAVLLSAYHTGIKIGLRLHNR
jgi:uncharacterized membrane protein